MNSYQSLDPSNIGNFAEAVDLSFEEHIHVANAYCCKKVFIDYLDHCNVESIDKKKMI